MTVTVPFIGPATLCAACGQPVAPGGLPLVMVEDWRRGANADLLHRPCESRWEWLPQDWEYTTVLTHPQIVRIYTRRRG